MPLEAPTDQVHATAWSAHRLRSASEDVRVRVIAATLALRCGAPTTPADLDDLCVDLRAIARGLGETPAGRFHPDERPIPIADPKAGPITEVLA